MRNPKVVHTPFPASPTTTSSKRISPPCTSYGRRKRNCWPKRTGADPAALLPHLRQVRWKLPQGLPVADMLRILTYADGYGTIRVGPRALMELAPEHTSVKCADCQGAPSSARMGSK